MNKLIAKLLVPIVSSLSMAALALDLDFANEPLAVKQNTLGPNIMLVIDDSNSMNAWFDGMDVFYAPGYDANKEYQCTSVTELTATDVDNVYVGVSKNITGTDNYTGTPFIIAEKSSVLTTYGWGVGPGTKPTNLVPEVPGASLTYSGFSGVKTVMANSGARRCFKIDDEFEVVLHARNCTHKNFCASYDLRLPKKNARKRTVTGNFLNWYFSGTYAEWGNTDRDGGFLMYDTAGNVSTTGTEFWSVKVADNFPTTYVDPAPAFKTKPSGSYSNYFNNVSIVDSYLEDGTANIIEQASNNCYVSRTAVYKYYYNLQVFFENLQINGSATIPGHPDNKTWFPGFAHDWPRGSYYGRRFYIDATQADCSTTNYVLNDQRLKPLYVMYDWTNVNNTYDPSSNLVTETVNFSDKTWVNKYNAARPYHTGLSHNWIGYKPGFHENNYRLHVAIDVAKKIIREIEDVQLGIATFFSLVTESSGTYSVDNVGNDSKDQSKRILPGDGGTLVHPLVDLNSSNTGDAAVRESLLNSVNMLAGNGQTPTAETMIGVARYLFGNSLTTKFDYENDNNGVPGGTDPTIGDVLDSSLTLKNISGSATASQAPPAYDATDDPFPESEFCRRNVIAVLTDGEPYADASYDATGDDLIEDYQPQGLIDTGKTNWTSESDVVTDTSNVLYNEGIVRTAGLLADHDFFPDWEGMQNITSYFIAFGSEDVTSNNIFDLAGIAGGQGKNNSYEATDGGTVIDALQEIVSEATQESASVTAVALSSVAELQAENFAYQASYNTEYWSGSLKAFYTNADGQFVEAVIDNSYNIVPVVDGSGNQNVSDDSSTIPAVWNAADVINDMYVIKGDLVNDEVSSTFRSFDLRRIFTSNDTGTGVAFKNYSDLSTAMKADIDVFASTQANATTARTQLINFLRGDVSNEVGEPVSTAAGTATELFRQRGRMLAGDVDVSGTATSMITAVPSGSILGDIIHSSPVYVGEPPRPWKDGQYGESVGNVGAYSSYQLVQANRTGMLYFGSNDGMLHAVTTERRTESGVTYPHGGEVFAYIPKFLSSTTADKGLHAIANPDYEHRYYVDMTATVSDVYMDLYRPAKKAAPEWRTVLVGGVRSGGKGLFALDITCPFVDSTTATTDDGTTIPNTCSDESFSQKNVLWEFSEATTNEDAELGYTFSQPVIAKVDFDRGEGVNTLYNGNGNGRWAAIVNNGYESDNGNPVLYVIFLDGPTGTNGSWIEGTDYLKLYANALDNSIQIDPVADTSSNKNGLSSPQAVDINSDGIVDRVYAGDLKGQLWAFDLSNPETLTNYKAGSLTWTVKRLFTAQTASTEPPQAITTPPNIARDADVFTLEKPNLMIMFATGIYVQESDRLLTSVASNIQTAYAVHDRGTESKDLVRYDTVTKADGSSSTVLEPRFLTEVVMVDSETDPNLKNDDLTVRRVTGEEVDIGNQFGWYMDLYSEKDGTAGAGSTERLGERVIYDGIVVNQLYVFNTLVPSTTACSGGSEGWTMLIDWTSGLTPDFGTFDANNDGTFDPESSSDQGYIGFKNDVAASQIGRGGDNLYDSAGSTVRKRDTFFGFTQEGKRLGWEEKSRSVIK